jgi:hypothetical protein
VGALRGLLPLLVVAQAGGILVADRGGVRSELALLVAVLARHRVGAEDCSASSEQVRSGRLLLRQVRQPWRLGSRRRALPAGGSVEATIEGRVARVSQQPD